MDPIGYYLTCDDAVHDDCYNLDDWPGFEGWDEPLPIFADTDADTPTHCDVCGLLIDHALTGEGYAYVVDEIVGYLEDGGNAAVIAEWIERYAPNFDADDRELIADAAYARIDKDARAQADLGKGR